MEPLGGVVSRHPKLQFDFYIDDLGCSGRRPLQATVAALGKGGADLKAVVEDELHCRIGPDKMQWTGSCRKALEAVGPLARQIGGRVKQSIVNLVDSEGRGPSGTVV